MLCRNNTRIASVLGLSVAVGTCSVASAAYVPLVNDTWLDATRTDPSAPIHSEYGVDGDSDGNLESAWYRSGTGSSTAMSSGHMIHAAGAAGSMSLTTHFAPSGSPVALSSVGDKMRLTWKFVPTGVTTTSTGNQDMRIAIADTPTASFLASDASPANTTYSGYGVFFNMRAGTIGNASAFRVMEWTTPGGANNLLSTAGAWTQMATATGVVGTTPGYAGGVEYTLTWEITKTAAGADISQSIVGGNVNFAVSYSDASAQPLTFDTFALRPQTPELTATSFDSTLFRVEVDLAPVPEPTSLLAVGSLAGLGLRRRR